MSTIYRCAGHKRGVCDYEAPVKWKGPCPVEKGGCGRYYDILVKSSTTGPSKTSFANLSVKEVKRYPSGMEQFDKVIGGGLVKGSPIVIAGPPKVGKCLGRGTPVLKYDGSIVPVEQVVTGDLLMGPDSKPRRVLSTARGVGPLYEIEPKKGGKPWVCNDVHVLTLQNEIDGNIFDIPLDKYLRVATWTKRSWKLFQPPELEFEQKYSASDRTVTPYFLGLWFGDGTKAIRDDGELRGVSITKPDAEVEAACRDEAARFGLRVTVARSYNDCPTFRLVGEKKHENPLTAALRKLLGDAVMRIPKQYLHAPKDVRVELLAGLLDSDGYRDKKGFYEIAQKDEGLADDIAFLARSLGLRVTHTIKVVNDTPYQKLMIYGNNLMQVPMRIPRKMPIERKKNALTTGFRVHPLGEGDYFGFELDGDGRFLLGDFTVTHNTSLMVRIAAGLSKHGKVLYTSGEQSADDIGTFVHRVGVTDADNVELRGNLGDAYKIQEIASDVKPVAIIVDSVNTAYYDDVKADAGSAAQMRALGNGLTEFAKEKKISVIMLAHVTKDGEIAGPKVFEHLVDAIVYFEPAHDFNEYGEILPETENYRRLSCSMNRFASGPGTFEELFEMTNQGVVPLDRSKKKSKLIQLDDYRKD